MEKNKLLFAFLILCSVTASSFVYGQSDKNDIEKDSNNLLNELYDEKNDIEKYSSFLQCHNDLQDKGIGLHYIRYSDICSRLIGKKAVCPSCILMGLTLAESKYSDYLESIRHQGKGQEAAFIINIMTSSDRVNKLIEIFLSDHPEAMAETKQLCIKTGLCETDNKEL